MKFHSDDILLFIVSIVTLALVFLSFRHGKQFGYINLCVFLSYSLLFYYGLFFKGEYGSSFLWWFFAIILTSIHFIILLVYLIVKFWKK
jgi:hypothetical protein